MDFDAIQSIWGGGWLVGRSGGRSGDVIVGDVVTDDQPPSSKTRVGSTAGLRIGIGSFSSEGGCGLLGRVPVLEKAPDLKMNLARAVMPLMVPRMNGRERCLEAFLRIFQCWSYLGQSISMWFLDSRVVLSQGQVMGLGDKGRKA